MQGIHCHFSNQIDFAHFFFLSLSLFFFLFFYQSQLRSYYKNIYTFFALLRCFGILKNFILPFICYIARCPLPFPLWAYHNRIQFYNEEKKKRIRCKHMIMITVIIIIPLARSRYHCEWARMYISIMIIWRVDIYDIIHVYTYQ